MDVTGALVCAAGAGALGAGAAAVAAADGWGGLEGVGGGADAAIGRTAATREAAGAAAPGEEVDDVRAGPLGEGGVVVADLGAWTALWAARDVEFRDVEFRDAGVWDVAAGEA